MQILEFWKNLVAANADPFWKRGHHTDHWSLHYLCGYPDFKLCNSTCVKRKNKLEDIQVKSLSKTSLWMTLLSQNIVQHKITNWSRDTAWFLISHNCSWRTLRATISCKTMENIFSQQKHFPRKTFSYKDIFLHGPFPDKIFHWG